jgi:adenine-specific DNA-methyltransferase
MRFVDGRAASNRLRDIFGEKVFTNPKDEFLLADLFKAMKVDKSDIVLDFFAGSGSTSHAVFELNRQQGSNCTSILVQIPEDLNKSLKLATGAANKITSNAISFLKSRNRPETVAEIAKERIRRAGAKVLEVNCHLTWNRDIGFRVLKVDSSNMQDIYYRPDEVRQAGLLDAIDNIKPDRTAEDLLFHVLIDWGVDLALPVGRETLNGKSVYFVDGNALAACFERDLTEDLVKIIAARHPLRAVFRDAGFGNDGVKINVEQSFKLLSPATEVKVI